MALTVPRLLEVCADHMDHFHSYADDQHDYLSFNPTVHGAENKCMLKLERCIENIRKWMKTNLLKLNDEKTEFIIFGTHGNLKKLSEKSNFPSETSRRQQRLVSYDYPIALSRTSLAKEGSFRFVGPSVWNSLPMYMYLRQKRTWPILNLA